MSNGTVCTGLGTPPKMRFSRQLPDTNPVPPDCVLSTDQGFGFGPALHTYHATGTIHGPLKRVVTGPRRSADTLPEPAGNVSLARLDAAVARQRTPGLAGQNRSVTQNKGPDRCAIPSPCATARRCGHERHSGTARLGRSGCSATGSRTTAPQRPRRAQCRRSRSSSSPRRGSAGSGAGSRGGGNPPFERHARTTIWQDRQPRVSALQTALKRSPGPGRLAECGAGDAAGTRCSNAADPAKRLALSQGVKAMVAGVASSSPAIR